MDGISLSWRLLPQSLVDRHAIHDRVIVRGDGADREFRFLHQDARPVLPVWVNRELRIVSWGHPRRESRLPRAKAVPVESVREGMWLGARPEEVEIPASFGWDQGVWFRIREGIQGILVRDEENTPVVYMLTEPATHYYQVMTRNRRMPVLCRERI